MSPAVQTRRELARYLQAQMMAARFSMSATEEEVEATGRTSVKTYLVEAHRHEDQSAARVLGEIARRLGARVSDTEDADLFTMQAGQHDLWCDTSMGRYWRLHTTAPVDDADRLHQSIVGATALVDNVWLPPDYLEGLAARTGSEMQTFSLSHDRRGLHDKGTVSRDFDYVTLRLWASKAGESLARLRRAAVFPHGVSVRSVRLRAGSAESDQDYCIAEYFHSGKVTVSGNSFDQHNAVLVQVLRDYQQLVERIEGRYGLGCEHQHLVGDPVVIPIEWTLPDLEYAVARMFAAVEPFRLWGVPERVSAHHYRARAVDLHVGSTLTFDITPDHIVIQLPRGTCGNTIVRFLGNLKYHVDSEVGASLVN